MARTIDRASRVISGTWGSVWLDDEALVETTALQAKFNKNKEKVYLCGQFVTDSKAMSADGTGSITIKKVDSGQLRREIPAVYHHQQAGRPGRLRRRADRPVQRQL